MEGHESLLFILAQAHFHAHMFGHSLLKFDGRHQVEFLLHFVANALRLHLCGTLQLFREALRGESIGIDTVDAIIYIGEILHHDEGGRGQEMEETLLGRLDIGEFWHDFDVLTLVFRELSLHIEGADGVDLIDTERKFTTVGIDIEDASTHGKLPRLINIIGLCELIFAQGMRHIAHGNLLSYR